MNNDVLLKNKTTGNIATKTTRISDITAALDCMSAYLPFAFALRSSDGYYNVYFNHFCCP